MSLGLLVAITAVGTANIVILPLRGLIYIAHHPTLLLLYKGDSLIRNW